ncbi:MAG TPA: hypothetical protein VK467_04120 [Gemmatimonadales bacterium]|nr:hypothetical protein [Gemmatimonadales bacterium]
MTREILIRWYALTEEMSILARGLVTVQHVGDGKLAPVSEFGKVNVEADGEFVYMLYQLDMPAVRAAKRAGSKQMAGALHLLPWPVSLTRGDRLTPSWEEDGWVMQVLPELIAILEGRAHALV